MRKFSISFNSCISCPGYKLFQGLIDLNECCILYSSGFSISFSSLFRRSCCPAWNEISFRFNLVFSSSTVVGIGCHCTSSSEDNENLDLRKVGNSGVKRNF